MGETVVVLKRLIQAPAPLVWALVADTNRFDRAAGLVPGRYEWKELTPGDESSRALVATAKQTGFDISWIEPPYDWIEGRFVRGTRTFVAGPVKRGGFRVELTPQGEDGMSTLVEATAWVAGDGLLAFIGRMIMKGKFKAALGRYVDAIDECLRRTEIASTYEWRKEPPAAAARRALMNHTVEEITVGKRTENSESDLQFRTDRFASAPVSEEIRKRIVQLVRSRPDEELAQIRPFEVARAWGLDKREVLRGFLYAARAGLVELRWQLNCPSCRVGSDSADSLSNVAREAHCDACNINFALDFAEHVEATFKVSPSIRKVETAVYCMSSPWFRPHVFGQITLAPKEENAFPCALPEGSLVFRTLRGRRRTTVDIDKAPASVAVHVSDDGIEVTSEGLAKGRDDTNVVVKNDTDQTVTVLIERTGWSADVVFGSVIASLPDFLDLFATEAPASGVELTVGALTLLFSDLTGSTALYERIGDARAFAVVEDHFQDMAKVIGKRGGAIVKTMGDAVMATFTSPADAMNAAIEMIAECERAHGDIGLSVKLGLHEGPCLAVRANDKLDYFGTTVNVAARLQAQAGGSQIVVHEELLKHPDIARIVAERAFPSTRFETVLKGIKEAMKLVAFDAGAMRSSGASPKSKAEQPETAKVG